MAKAGPGFGIYIHWPFCETICPYCDFNVHQAVSIDDAAWRDALRAELAHYAEETKGRTVSSIYFGGGTPSLMKSATVADLIDATAAHWTLDSNVEITLECNPTAAEHRRLSNFKDAGVNRLSVGVQSFDDSHLAFLGRGHTGELARTVVDEAQDIFDRVTFDLIYALPDQSLDDWAATLEDVLARGAGHLSLYQLTIEPGTPFHRNGVATSDEDAAADLFEVTGQVLQSGGMPAYEISNHAVPGEESRHNISGWRGGDYIGIGPGAHGRLTIDGSVFATHQIHNPVRWLEKIDEEGHGTAKRRHLAADDRARERLMMGLRLREGVDLQAIERETGCRRETFVDQSALDYIVEGGLLSTTNGRLSVTDAGRLRLNSILATLISI